MTDETQQKPEEVKPEVKKKKKTPTPAQTDKQIMLLSLLKTNFGKIARGEKPMRMYDMMLQAGYSESSAKQQANILYGLRDEIDPFLAKLDEIQKDAIERIPKAASRANYRDFIDVIERTFKMKQVLTGRPSQRTAVDLSPDSKKYLDDILSENS